MATMSLAIALVKTLAGVILIVWTIYKLAPSFLCCLFPRLIVARVLESPAGGLPERYEDAQRLAAELLTRSFVSLGSKTEKAPLWGRESRDVCLVSPRHKCFASISLSHTQSFHYFYTPMSSDGVVLTASARFPNLSSPGYRLVTDPEKSVVQLLEIHAANIAELESQGYRIWDDWSATARVQATYHYYAAPATRRYMRRMGALVGLVIAIALAAGVALVYQGVTRGEPDDRSLLGVHASSTLERQDS